eukprot:3109322-Pleurochrysis_carterae.AAC.2
MYQNNVQYDVRACLPRPDRHGRQRCRSSRPGAFDAAEPAGLPLTPPWESSRAYERIFMVRLWILHGLVDGLPVKKHRRSVVTAALLCHLCSWFHAHGA